MSYTLNVTSVMSSYMKCDVSDVIRDKCTISDVIINEICLLYVKIWIKYNALN